MFPVICLSTCDFCCKKTLQGLLAALVLLEEQGILHRVMNCPILQLEHVVPCDTPSQDIKSDNGAGVGQGVEGGASPLL